jgi:uncharacterized protein YlxW (UPF0749 family)
VLTPVIALLAGLLFAVSSQTARGSDLRSDREEITQVIYNRVLDIQVLDQERKQLAAQVEALSAAAAQSDATVASIEQQAADAATYAGLTPIQGPGVRVTLTDGPLGPNGELPPGARPDDVIIHQSDVQGILNAMWSAGADGIMVQGHRIIGTSAVRCVGNTLLLRGKTYSPPFVIVAIGDQDAIETALQEAPGVELFLDAVTAFGLGYDVETLDQLTLPAYDGPLGVTHAEVMGG